MSETSGKRLYELLPAIYRQRDAAQGEPLLALMQVLEEQLEALEENVRGLYENWFVETAEEWVLPYIGDLLGVRGLGGFRAGEFSQRAFVANTLRYRRRKGTAPVLEQLARDITGWPARVVEYFELLGWTQQSNHIRWHNKRTPDLRKTAELEWIDGPFDRAAHTADVRSIALGRGRHNIPNIGLFLWRLQPYAVQRSDARKVKKNCYTFSPLGRDMALFNQPQTETTITHLAEEINVPGPLRRRPLYDELGARRCGGPIVEEQSCAEQPDGEKVDGLYFGTQPVLQLFLDGSEKPLPPEAILICDLANWREPPGNISCRQPDGATKDFAIQAAVDPALGRLALPPGMNPGSVEVSYSYGFSADVGAGPYDRSLSVEEDDALEKIDWQAGVSRSEGAAAGAIFSSLNLAIAEWNQWIDQHKGTEARSGLIAILDSRTYEDNLDEIVIPANSSLTILAAGWPALETADAPGVRQRFPGRNFLVPSEVRPHLRSDIRVKGTADLTDISPGSLTLNGLLVEGQLQVSKGQLGWLRLRHCTIVPADSAGALIARRRILAEADNVQLHICISRSICGAIELSAAARLLRIEGSIVTSGEAGRGSQEAIEATNTPVEIGQSTVLGTTRARSLEASECIFAGKAEVTRRQEGCVRFCYVPPESRTPRRYRCQPDTALKGVADAAARAAIQARVQPAFTELPFDAPAFAQLATHCPEEIRSGAEDGSEMGVFRHLQAPQREAVLRQNLEEYLRFGLQAGIFYVT